MSMRRSEGPLRKGFEGGKRVGDRRAKGRRRSMVLTRRLLVRQAPMIGDETDEE